MIHYSKIPNAISNSQIAISKYDNFYPKKFIDASSNIPFVINNISITL